MMFGLIVVGTGAVDLLADEPPPADLAAAVQRLVAELDSPRRNQRADAETRLRELGPRILPLLPAPADVRSPSVRSALQKLRGQLEDELAESALKPVTATIQGPASVDQFAAELAQQTGNPGPLSASRHATTVAGLSNTSYWLAIRKLEEQGVATIPLIERPTAASLLGEDVIPRTDCAVGVFRVAVVSADRRPLVGKARQDRLRLRLWLQVEPRLRALFVRFRPAAFTATDALGQRLPSLLSSDALIELLGSDGQQTFPVTLDLVVSSDWGSTSVHLSGQFEVELAAQRVPFEFKLGDLQQSRHKRAAGVDLEVARLEAADRQVLLRVRTAYDRGGTAFESHRTWLYHNAAWLTTDGRQHIKPQLPLDVRQSQDGAIQIHYRFEIDGPDQDQLRFVYEAPTLIAKRTVAFSIPELTIPQPNAPVRKRQGADP